MNVQIFTGIADSMQGEVNDWLNINKELKISTILQSTAYQPRHPDSPKGVGASPPNLTISVFYE